MKTERSKGFFRESYEKHYIKIFFIILLRLCEEKNGGDQSMRPTPGAMQLTGSLSVFPSVTSLLWRVFVVLLIIIIVFPHDTRNKTENPKK